MDDTVPKWGSCINSREDQIETVSNNSPSDVGNAPRTIRLARFRKDSKTFMGRNFLKFVMLLAGGLSAFLYQKVLSMVGEYTLIGL